LGDFATLSFGGTTLWTSIFFHEGCCGLTVFIVLNSDIGNKPDFRRSFRGD
jgi:hypothetical protein